jgi:hypothetical protein
MLHVMKLAVGIRDLAHLQAVQSARQASDPPLRHRTRNSPRRAAEITAGGSLYWVVSGAVLVRQRILDIRPDHWEDGSACAAFLLDPTLVPVAGRPVRAFQGWRYLEPSAAPPDFGGLAVAEGAEAMPEPMRRDLRALGLL